MTDNLEQLYCSFCGKTSEGKTSEQATAPVAGPHVYIFDQCILICVAYLPPRTRASALARSSHLGDAALTLEWRFRIAKPTAAET